MASGSARVSGGPAAILVDFFKGMGCSGGLGDFPRRIFFKKRFMCVIEGWELRSSTSSGLTTPPNPLHCPARVERLLGRGPTFAIYVLLSKCTHLRNNRYLCGTSVY